METYSAPTSLLTQRGYAALLATLIISAVTLALAFQAGVSGYFARLAVLEAEYKAISRGHAYSCSQIALFELSANTSYRPKEDGDIVTLGKDTFCTIKSIESANDLITVVVYGSHKNAYTAFEFILKKKPLSEPPFIILDFREI